ncbi:hypothetical protein PMAYCL1PPCAC_24799, partial [Pristionchus mayeri]
HFPCSCFISENVNFSDGVIRFEADKVDKAAKDENYSTIINVRGVPWKAEVGRGGEDLYISLYCMPNQSMPWSVDVDSEFTLINSDTSKNVIEK